MRSPTATDCSRAPCHKRKRPPIAVDGERALKRKQVESVRRVRLIESPLRPWNKIDRLVAGYEEQRKCDAILSARSRERTVAVQTATSTSYAPPPSTPDGTYTHFDPPLGGTLQRAASFGDRSDRTQDAAECRSPSDTHLLLVERASRTRAPSALELDCGVCFGATHAGRLLWHVKDDRLATLADLEREAARFALPEDTLVGSRCGRTDHATCVRCLRHILLGANAEVRGRLLRVGCVAPGSREADCSVLDASPPGSGIACASATMDQRAACPCNMSHPLFRWLLDESERVHARHMVRVHQETVRHHVGAIDTAVTATSTVTTVRLAGHDPNGQTRIACPLAYFDRRLFAVRSCGAPCAVHGQDGRRDATDRDGRRLPALVWCTDALGCGGRFCARCLARVAPDALGCLDCAPPAAHAGQRDGAAAEHDASSLLCYFYDARRWPSTHRLHHASATMPVDADPFNQVDAHAVTPLAATTTTTTTAMAAVQSLPIFLPTAATTTIRDMPLGPTDRGCHRVAQAPCDGEREEIQLARQIAEVLVADRVAQPCFGCGVPLEKTTMCNALRHCQIEVCYVCGAVASAPGSHLPASHWDADGCRGCPRFDSNAFWQHYGAGADDMDRDVPHRLLCVEDQCYDDERACCDSDHAIGIEAMHEERRMRHLCAKLGAVRRCETARCTAVDTGASGLYERVTRRVLDEAAQLAAVRCDPPRADLCATFQEALQRTVTRANTAPRTSRPSTIGS
jgi:hypothetical protein